MSREERPVPEQPLWAAVADATLTWGNLVAKGRRAEADLSLLPLEDTLLGLGFQKGSALKLVAYMERQAEREEGSLELSVEEMRSICE